MTENAPGARLAQLLIGAFDAMVDEVVAELARRGHPGVTAGLEFALTAITHGADNAADLGRALGISRQAAAKTVTTLEQLGYVARIDDPDDARLKRLRVRPRGHEMLAIGSAAFDALRARWAARLGPGGPEAVEKAIALLAVPSGDTTTGPAGP